jgi:hypothetical protein
MLSNIIAYAVLFIMVTGATSLVAVSVLLVRSRDGMDALPAGILALFFLGAAWSIAQHLGV